MLGTGDLSITNLFYANSSFTGMVPIQTINSRIFSFNNGGIGGSNDFIDSRPIIYEVDSFGTILRESNLDYGMWTFGRETSWLYNVKDNCFYTLVRLKSDHPDNTTGDDNDPVVVKVDSSNFNHSIVCHTTGAGLNNRVNLLNIVDDDLYISSVNNNNTVGNYSILDISTGIITTVSTAPAGRWGIGFYNDIIYSQFWTNTQSHPDGLYTVYSYNFFTDTAETLIFDLYAYVNPNWDVNSDNQIGVGNPLIKGKFIYFMVYPKFVTNDRRIEILIFNLETKDFINRLIGSQTTINFEVDNHFITESMNIYLRLNNNVEFYAPEITKANTLLTVHDGNLLNPKKIVKSPDVPIQDYPVRFDATKLEVGVSNEYGEVDGSGNVLKLSELNYQGSGIKLDLNTTLGSPIFDQTNDQAILTGSNLSFSYMPWIPDPYTMAFYIAFRAEIPTSGSLVSINRTVDSYNWDGYSIMIFQDNLVMMDAIRFGYHYYGGIEKPTGVVNIIAIHIPVSSLRSNWYLDLHLNGNPQADIYINNGKINANSIHRNGAFGAFYYRGRPILNLGNAPKFERLQIGRGEPNIQELNDWLTNGD